MVILRPIIGAALPLLLTALPAAGAAQAAPGPAGGADTARTTRRIAPGVRLESYDRVEADRWLRIDELVVDLDAPGLGVEYLGGPAPAPGAGRGAVRGTVADAAARHPAGSGRRVVAAVNGDFFDIRRTGAPLGPGIAAGRLLHSPARGAGAAVGFGPGPVGRVLRLALDGTVTLPGGAVRRLVGHNSARPPANGIAAYTAEWTGTGGALPPGADAEAEIRHGRVTAVRRPARGIAPLPGGVLLAGRGTAAAEVAALRPGDPVHVSARPTAGAGRPLPTAAVGGREPLVVDGVPQNLDHIRNNTPAPRTAVGFSRDGRQVRIITVDGRQRDSAGITLTALGRLLREHGAHNALNLDGGGSSTLLAGHPGGADLTVENSPSDGSLRTVPNGLVLTARSGSGRPAGYEVTALAGTARVFPGLSRTLTATAYDETLGPAVAPRPDWWTAPGSAGRAGRDGVFHADRPGSAPVYAGRAERHRSAGHRAHAPRAPHTGELRMEVLGPLTRIEASEDHVALPAPGDRRAFQLLGSDSGGNLAPVEARDVRWQYDRSRWRVDGDGAGGFTVTALSAHGTAELRATVPATGATTVLPVSVGEAEFPEAVHPGEGENEEESGEEDSGEGEEAEGGPADGAWADGGAATEPSPDDPARAPGEVRGASGPPGPVGGPGGAGSGTLPASGRVPGPAPRWWTVAGTGSHRAGVPRDLAATVATGQWLGPRPAWLGGTVGAADGPRATRGVPYDVVRRRSARGGLEPAVPAWLPRRPTAGPGTAPAAHAGGAAGENRHRAWRFAVLPGGLSEAEARQAVGRAAAGQVDFVLSAPPGPDGSTDGPTHGTSDGIPRAAGDGRVGEGRAGVGQAGRSSAGWSEDATTETFRRMPGAVSFRHRGVRFVPLDTSRSTLEGGGAARLGALRAGIEAAARDPETGALAVVEQHAGPEQVDDREAAARSLLLADFRRTSGKSAAVITLGAPAPGAARSDGVLSVRTADGDCTVLDVDTAATTAGRSWLSAHPRNPR
ncbi:phosphodiester glycosidase family protein [Streptomyces sp. NPDC089799]|uniref:phosphodiester glycosidase family protein n=1 Tax=Streptomyces sp. NPDC089799 TaxID=3155066 RepID=UPI00341337E3